MTTRRLPTAVLRPLALSAAAASLASPPTASAGDLPVYGGPEYSPATGGYTGRDQPQKGRLVGDGVAFTRATKVDASGRNLGDRPFRITPAGPVELGRLGTGTDPFNTYVYATNASGTAVGFDEGAGLPVRWDAGTTTPTALGTLGPHAPSAFANAVNSVNAAGTSVGWVYTYSPTTGGTLGARPVRWDAGGTAATELQLLGTNPGIRNGYAFGVNAAGTVVGASDRYDAAGNALGVRAVRWDAGGTTATELQGLDAPAGAPASFVDAGAGRINAAGVVIGAVTRFSATNVAGHLPVRWAPGSTTPTFLETLGTDPAGNVQVAQTRALNDAGLIVGTVTKYDAAGQSKGTRAVRWGPGGTAATELGALATAADGSADVTATDVNAGGDVVGYGIASVDPNASADGFRAIYWPRGSTAAVDLNALIDPAGGWTLHSALGISDGGWVTGGGTYDPDGPGGQAAYDRTFLLQVPEPGPAGLLGAAAVGLLAAWRRPRGRIANGR